MVMAILGGILFCTLFTFVGLWACFIGMRHDEYKEYLVILYKHSDCLSKQTFSSLIEFIKERDWERISTTNTEGKIFYTYVDIRGGNYGVLSTNIVILNNLYIYFESEKEWLSYWKWFKTTSENDLLLWSADKVIDKK